MCVLTSKQNVIMCHLWHSDVQISDPSLMVQALRRSMLGARSQNQKTYCGKVQENEKINEENNRAS